MRKIIVVVVCCVAILAGGFAGYHWYQVRKQNHLISLARQFLAKSDERNALLSLQLVLRSNPNNLTAVRMMADLMGAIQSPTALAWRKRVVLLNPNSVDDKLILAQTAILLHDYNSATNALGLVSADDRKTAAFQNVAGSVAEAANHMAEAETHFTEAARLQPNNQAIQLNLAMVWLHGTNLSTKAEARTVLNRIAAGSENSGLRCMALRELTIDAEHSRQMKTALALSQELVRQTNASFGDQLLRLDILKKTGSAELNPALANAQREAVSDVVKINAMATWQMANSSLDSTLAWLHSLPMNLQTNQPTALMIAQCLTFKRDWTGLQALIQKQNWGKLEFTRHAFLARALLGENLDATSETEWQQAVTLASDQEYNLVMLLRLAAQWNWQGKAEDMLWAIVNKFPGEQWANDALVQTLFASGKTRPLMMVYGQQLNWDPSNLAAENNLAKCALLLDAQELKPQDLALASYQKAPNDPAFISTYAFSLYLQKKYPEALKVIEKIPAVELKDPSIAGYYGLIIKAAGNPAQARMYLDLALESNLLPEEKELFLQARAGT